MGACYGKARGGPQQEQLGVEIHEARELLLRGEAPAGMHVDGDLDLGPGSALTSLPDDLCVSGNLEISGCTALTSLGDGLRVEGSLNLRGCAALTNLGDGLRVGGSLDLCGCSALQERYYGNMKALFKKLATALGPEAGLSLAGWDAVEQVPNGFGVGGNLDLVRCSALTSLPDGLCVGGKLNLRGCSALQERHRGDMNAFFEQLSAMLGPEAGLSLEGWDAVEQVPGGFGVGGDLQLAHCDALTSLPVGLSVGGNLGLRNCPALTSVGDGLTVGGSLSLDGCSALANLGDGIRVGGNLYLGGCSALESLSASILEWPLREDGDRHNIHLSGSGLSQETLDWLREAAPPGLKFHVGQGGKEAARDGFASVEEAAVFWAEAAGVQAAGVRVASDDAHAATITRFLSRLRSAKEFGISETRRALAARVVDVLKLLSEDDPVRAEIVTRMADSLDVGGDEPVWALNQMTLTAEVAEARGDRSKLEALGRRVLRLVVVHEHAKRKANKTPWVNAVCAALRFEIGLRDVLELPVASAPTIYPSYPRVEYFEQEAAMKAALALTDKDFQVWLAEWPEWQRQQRHEAAEDILHGGWSSLEAVKRRQSLYKRTSRRLSRLLNLSGDKLEDPVTLDDGKSVWSLSDLLRHWERTGLNLHNAPVSVEQLRSDLKRAVAPSRAASVSRVEIAT